MENKHSLFSELKTRKAFQSKNDESFEMLIQHAFKEWKEEAGSISEYFKNRDRIKAREPMIYQLSRFLQVLFWVNKKEIRGDFSNWKEQVKELPNLPVNGIERLSFILDQPDHYQSFIQLSELFFEWEKKSVMLQRRSK